MKRISIEDAIDFLMQFAEDPKAEIWMETVKADVGLHEETVEIGGNTNSLIADSITVSIGFKFIASAGAA